MQEEGLFLLVIAKKERGLASLQGREKSFFSSGYEGRERRINVSLPLDDSFSP